MPQKSKHTNFRGKSFRGKNLAGFDFSFTDIRGADFSNAILAGANFSHAKSGLKKQWIAILVAVIIILSILAGSLSAYAAAAVGDFLLSKPPEDIKAEVTPGATIIPTIFVFLAYAVFLIITVSRGLCADLGKFSVIIAAIVGITAALPGGDISREIILFDSIIIAVGIAGSLLGAVALAIGISTFGLHSAIVVAACIALGAFLGTWETIHFYIETGEFWLEMFAVVCLVSIPLLGLSAYMGWKSGVEDRRYSLIRAIAVNLCSLGGTIFRGANLSDANFTQATLEHTDFRNANLTLTLWIKSKQIERARIEGTYLDNPLIRQLLVSGNGQDKNYDNQNLRALNLGGANLVDASFLGADLSESLLQEANLSRAKLVQCQLYRTNLSHACLTGAYIQDWAISTDTCLEGVKCEYIFMRLPTRNDPDPCRKPDNKNENFKEGDFSDFIAPIVKTLELYRQQNVDLRQIASTFKSLDLFHYQGIDPSAAAIALKQLAKQYPEAGIEVVALEGRGEEKIRLQARVTGETDRSRLSAEYFEKYQEIASLPYDDLQSLLAAMAEKDERIRSLENMVMTAMKSDKFYVETYYAFSDSSDEYPTVKKILILTANPQNIDKRRLDAEVREIQTGLERAKKRDQFEIISKWAVRPDDLRRALLDYEPQIVHFSGYGAATDGLALENELGQLQMVSTAALAKLFEVFKEKVECVLLNACYSETQAEVISQHIDYVIGMHQAIGNRAAIEFAVGFYDALGAGRSIEDAFKLGCIAIDLEGIPESLTPVLKKKKE
jgi:uncharacterized protein YjbI with pentapeptide repeats